MQTEREYTNAEYTTVEQQNSANLTFGWRVISECVGK